MPELPAENMGTIHGKLAEIMTETLAEYARKSGGRYDTFYRKLRRKFPAETWGADSVLSAEHIALLSGESGGREERKTRKVPAKIEARAWRPAGTREATPAWSLFAAARKAAAKIPWRALITDTLLIGVVVWHAGLIWYDCAQLWGEPGLIGGGLIFVIALVTLLFASNPNLPRTSSWALVFMFLVDCAAYWVHFPTFRTPNVPDVVTSVLCIFICASSWVALFLFRDSKQD